MKNKKAVSIMVSYVVLIAIVMSLAIGVYGLLKFYANIEPLQECPDDTSLILQDYECDMESKEITLTLVNRGRHNIYGFYARGTNNSEGIASSALPDASGIRGRPHYIDTDDNREKDFLPPNQEYTEDFYYNHINSLEIIQIQPFIEEEGNTTICDNAVITQSVSGCG